jgi:DNA-directed RNA polymerase subunit L
VRQVREEKVRVDVREGGSDLRLNIVNEEDGRLEMEVGGEGHTLLNLLQSFLLANKSVEMAGYSKPHPLMDRSVLYVYMKKKGDHSKVLLKSAGDAKKNVNDFLKKFDAQLAKKR